MEINEMYGLDFEDKSLAIANEFVKTLNKSCYQLGVGLKPFCFYANEKQKENGVIDFADFTGLLNPQNNLMTEIAEYRKEMYKAVGIDVDITDADKKKMLIYDYLMSISVCYVEVPKWRTKDGKATPTYDKFLVTRSPQLMGTWIDYDKREMQAKYSPKIQLSTVSFNEKELKFVKLNNAAKGNTITVPRSSFSIDKMTCIPVFMLYAFIEGAKTVFKDKMVKFSYLKDNGTIRELTTTLNEGILHEYYDNNFVAQMLSGVDINSVNYGGMSVSSKFSRGYVKVPEVGASIYDGTGCRSLNFARILKAEVVTEVDTTYINVDLSSVVANFGDGIDYLVKTDAQAVKAVWKALTETEIYDEIPVVIAKIKEYAQDKVNLLSTTYQRSLHKFMINNPQWFPLYTGLPNAGVVSSANFGITTMDF
jgi:hypothetical protein